MKQAFLNFFESRIKLGVSLGVLLLLFVILYAVFVQAPAGFEPKATLTIEEGGSISTIAEDLAEQQFIRSPFLFKVLTTVTFTRSNVIAGDYYFHEPANLFTLTQRVVSGDYELDSVTVRVPEGATIYDVAEIMEAQFDKFNSEKFIARAEDEKAEGYLFPDTYLFLPNVTEDKIYETLRSNFEEQIVEVLPRIETFGVSLNDAIIMASIIEKESANDFTERKTISGILWNRIDIGMALQVDATFNYINGKNTFELSTDDLKIDSPYNTYLYPGLPAGPISNPSLDSIIAAVTPIDSNYFFYLHDRGGNVHYSRTFEQHKQNKFKYLR